MAIYPNVYKTRAGIVTSHKEARKVKQVGSPEQERLIREARTFFEGWAPGMSWEGYVTTVEFPFEETMDGYLACKIVHSNAATGLEIVYGDVMFTTIGELVTANEIELR
jgi:hypothetical protein